MNLLFWLFWSADLLFTLFVILAARFRGGMSLSTDLHSWLLIGLFLCLVGGPVLRFAFRLRTAGLIVAAFPVAALVGAWLFSVIFKKQV